MNQNHENFGTVDSHGMTQPPPQLHYQPHPPVQQGYYFHPPYVYPNPNQIQQNVGNGQNYCPQQQQLPPPPPPPPHQYLQLQPCYNLHPPNPNMTYPNFSPTQNFGPTSQPPPSQPSPPPRNYSNMNQPNYGTGHEYGLPQSPPHFSQQAQQPLEPVYNVSSSIQNGFAAQQTEPMLHHEHVQYLPQLQKTANDNGGICNQKGAVVGFDARHQHVAVPAYMEQKIKNSERNNGQIPPNQQWNPQHGHAAPPPSHRTFPPSQTGSMSQQMKQESHGRQRNSDPTAPRKKTRNSNKDQVTQPIPHQGGQPQHYQSQPPFQNGAHHAEIQSTQDSLSQPHPQQISNSNWPNRHWSWNVPLACYLQQQMQMAALTNSQWNTTSTISQQHDFNRHPGYSPPPQDLGHPEPQLKPMNDADSLIVQPIVQESPSSPPIGTWYNGEMFYNQHLVYNPSTLPPRPIPRVFTVMPFPRNSPSAETFMSRGDSAFEDGSPQAPRCGDNQQSGEVNEEMRNVSILVEKVKEMEGKIEFLQKQLTSAEISSRFQKTEEKNDQSQAACPATETALGKNQETAVIENEVIVESKITVQDNVEIGEKIVVIRETPVTVQEQNAPENTGEAEDDVKKFPVVESIAVEKESVLVQVKSVAVQEKNFPDTVVAKEDVSRNGIAVSENIVIDKVSIVVRKNDVIDMEKYVPSQQNVVVCEKNSTQPLSDKQSKKEAEALRLQKKKLEKAQIEKLRMEKKKQEDEERRRIQAAQKEKNMADKAAKKFEEDARIAEEKRIKAEKAALQKAEKMKQQEEKKTRRKEKKIIEEAENDRIKAEEDSWMKEAAKYNAELKKKLSEHRKNDCDLSNTDPSQKSSNQPEVSPRVQFENEAAAIQNKFQNLAEHLTAGTQTNVAAIPGKKAPEDEEQGDGSCSSSVVELDRDLSDLELVEDEEYDEEGEYYEDYYELEDQQFD